MGKQQHLSRGEMGMHKTPVQASLDFIRYLEGDDVGPVHGLGNGQNPESGLSGLLPVFAAWPEPDHNIQSAVLQVQGLGPALVAETDDFFSLSTVFYLHVCHGKSLPWITSFREKFYRIIY
jgi:hypothetical protein